MDRDKIFRKKNLDKVTSPENLDSYLKVTNPSMWMIFAAIIIILAGALVWSFVGTIESKVTGVIVDDEGGAVCYVSEKFIDDIELGMTVRVNNNKYTVTGISTEAVPDNLLTDYAMELGGFQKGEYIYALTLDKSPGKGNHKCEIVLEVLKPIDFLGKAYGEQQQQ